MNFSASSQCFHLFWISRNHIQWGKSRKKVEKNSQCNFIKQGRGGSKAVYKLYKKTGKMVRAGFPYSSDRTFCEEV